MAPRICGTCGLNLDKYGTPGTDKHRCLSAKAGPAKRGFDPYAVKPPEPIGRLLRPPNAPTQPTAKPQPDQTEGSSAQPSNSDLMAAITRLTEQFEKLQAALTSQSRTDG